jgi:hypothetical protein
MDSVTEPTDEKQTPHVNVVGYIIAGGVGLLLLPLLPFLLLLRLVGRSGDEQSVSEI